MWKICFNRDHRAYFIIEGFENSFWEHWLWYQKKNKKTWRMILLHKKRIQDFTQGLFSTTQDSKTQWSSTLLKIPFYTHGRNLILLFTSLHFILKEFTLWLITTLCYITQYILISKEFTLQLNTCNSTHLSLHHYMLLSMSSLC